jgi:hypothetical protein
MTVEANEGIVSRMLEDTVMNLDENLEVLMTTPHFFPLIFIRFSIELVSNPCGLITPSTFFCFFHFGGSLL